VPFLLTALANTFTSRTEKLSRSTNGRESTILPDGLSSTNGAAVAPRLKEEQLRREEEKLRESELKIAREIAERRQELVRSRRPHDSPSTQVVWKADTLLSIAAAHQGGDAPQPREPACSSITQLALVAQPRRRRTGH
jgi:hypothetical protein